MEAEELELAVHRPSSPENLKILNDGSHAIKYGNFRGKYIS